MNFKTFFNENTKDKCFDNKDFSNVGNMIADVLDSLLLEEKQRKDICTDINKKVVELCSNRKIYSEAY